jgi:hypothetical protein
MRKAKKNRYSDVYITYGVMMLAGSNLSSVDNFELNIEN